MAARRTRALRRVTIGSLELPLSAQPGGQATCLGCHALDQTMSRASSPAGFASGRSVACSRIKLRIRSAPNEERSGHGVRRSDGQQGPLGAVGTRQRQMSCRTMKPSAKIRLIESACSRAGAHGRPAGWSRRDGGAGSAGVPPALSLRAGRRSPATRCPCQPLDPPTPRVRPLPSPGQVWRVQSAPAPRVVTAGKPAAADVAVPLVHGTAAWVAYA